MSRYLALTVIADDRPGIVEQVAEVVANNEGNWLESAMSRLGGKFAGILLVHIPPHRESSFRSDLANLAARGIRVSAEAAEGTLSSTGEKANLSIIGNDRKGIVREISSILAGSGVNVNELHTRCENAPMSGELLFRTEATVELPPGLDRDDLVSLLERLSDDLIVEFEDQP